MNMPLRDASCLPQIEGFRSLGTKWTCSIANIYLLFIHVCSCMGGYICEWRPEDKLRCQSSEILSTSFWDRVSLGWLGREPQRSSCLCFPGVGITTACGTVPSFCMRALEVKSRPFCLQNKCFSDSHHAVQTEHIRTTLGSQGTSLLPEAKRLLKCNPSSVHLPVSLPATITQFSHEKYQVLSSRNICCG